MKRLFIIPIILLSIFCSAFALQAQDITHHGDIIKQIDKDSIELTIYFQRSYSTYSPNLVQKGISNEIRISDFDREFHKLISDENIAIQYINIESAASPEGITDSPTDEQRRSSPNLKNCSPKQSINIELPLTVSIGRASILSLAAALFLTVPRCLT